MPTPSPGGTPARRSPIPNSWRSGERTCAPWHTPPWRLPRGSPSGPRCSGRSSRRIRSASRAASLFPARGHRTPPGPRRGPLRRIPGSRPAGQPLLAERLAATRDRLERVAAERYAIELFITENTDPARMERFLVRARELALLQDLFVIPMPGGGKYRLRVVYGEFASREDAREAERGLPPRYQQAFRTSPRSV